MFSSIIVITQLFFTVITGLYFLGQLRNQREDKSGINEDSRHVMERLNAMRRISLTKPLTEETRPSTLDEIIGQENGVEALKIALCGKNPQHVIIYGPPGVGKTAASRVAMEFAKKSLGTPFKKDAKFIEVDATIMQYDERSVADPLIGSVHDPIYQGSGAFGANGIPQPKPGAVTKAQGGILFLDEIGELPNEQLNKLLKVLEDRRVTLESSYYNSSDKKLPIYIREAFEMGLPADFRLIGATTAPPSKIPEAVRTRCVEVYFNALTRAEVMRIIINSAANCGIAMENGVREIIADYATNGRDAVKIMQSASNLARMEGRCIITLSDAKWVIKAGRYEKRSEPCLKDDEKIVDITIVKPYGLY